jgi:hypothetical protein
MTIIKIAREKVNKIDEYKLGSDPEFAVVDITTGEHKSIIGKLGGTKNKPIVVKGDMSYQEDNTLAEFTVTPTLNAKHMMEEVDFLIAYVNSILEPKGLIIDKDIVTATYSDEELNNKKARAFGCTPSYSAWDLLEGEIPANASMLPTRSGGGHIHIGIANNNFETSVEIARNFDLFCGLPSVFTCSDTIRKNSYGKAGECRFKSYGVEVRSLSNHIFNNINLLEYYFKQVNSAVKAMNNGFFFSDCPQEDVDGVINAINTHNEQAALHYMEKYEIMPYSDYIDIKINNLKTKLKQE